MPLNTRKYTDIDVSFMPHPVTGDILKKTDYMAVIQSVKNLIFLNHYEKPFHPDKGANVRKMLFEPIDPNTGSMLETEITQMIDSYETRATVIQIVATPDYDNEGYSLKIIFSIDNVAAPLSITTFLKRLR